MTPRGGKHPSAEMLRAYGQGRLESSEAAQIEQHLLECAQCCAVLKALPPDAFMTLLRETQPDAGKRHEASAGPARAIEPAAPVPRRRWLWGLGILGLLVLGAIVLVVLQWH